MMNEEKLVDFRVGDETYTTRLTKKASERRPYCPTNPNEIRAIIPGTIIRIYAQEGMTVKQGEPLLVEEAMKMENTIRMPKDGVIERIAVCEQERVVKGALLVSVMYSD